MERAASSSYTKHEYEAEDPVPADRGDDGEKDQLPSEGGVPTRKFNPITGKSNQIKQSLRDSISAASKPNFASPFSKY